MYDMATNAHDESTALNHLQRARKAVVDAQLDRLNSAIKEAVDAGLSIELRRSRRHHCGAGSWGDNMTAVIVDCR